ncbi:hypothetical protein [Streptomyces venezuelae]|uniref:hypothetical protein n=1 Tax=Streptomyces venezuelae TaxID=54571 RepID=UPI00363B5987
MTDLAETRPVGARGGEPSTASAEPVETAPEPAAGPVTPAPEPAAGPVTPAPGPAAEPVEPPAPPVRSRAVRLLRLVAYVALPAELVLFVVLLGGVPIPRGVFAVSEVVLLALLLAEGLTYLRLRRRGLSRRAAVAELVPESVLRIMGHELRIMASLVRWVARRPVDVADADAVFPHARDQAALMYGFAFVCLVESAGMSYLLADWPVAHAIVLVLDVYTVLFVLGLQAAAVTRPHTLTGDVLRLRQAAHVDVSVPLDRIASVRHELLFTHDKKAEGELNLAVGSQTSVTVELTEPVDAPRFFGAPRPVRLIRCHADDARALYRALDGAVTRVRTAPWPSPGPPPRA